MVLGSARAGAPFLPARQATPLLGDRGRLGDDRQGAEEIEGVGQQVRVAHHAVPRRRGRDGGAQRGREGRARAPGLLQRRPLGSGCRGGRRGGGLGEREQGGGGRPHDSGVLCAKGSVWRGEGSVCEKKGSVDGLVDGRMDGWAEARPGRSIEGLYWIVGNSMDFHSQNGLEG